MTFPLVQGQIHRDPEQPGLAFLRGGRELSVLERANEHRLRELLGDTRAHHHPREIGPQLREQRMVVGVECIGVHPFS